MDLPLHQRIGLDYFGARYFSGAQGRFTSPDAKQMTRRHLQFPQKWNKYEYARNNPLLYVDPDGLDDWIVFRPTAGATSTGDWARAKAAVEARPGDHFITYDNGAATVARYNEALSTPGAHVIFVGHSTSSSGPPQNANGVLLANGISQGNKGSEARTETFTPATDGSAPNLSISIQATTGLELQAASVGVFGCNSVNFSDQYAGTKWTGMYSGTDSESTIQAMDSAAAGWVTAAASNDTNPLSLANCAFVNSADPKYDNNGDKVIDRLKEGQP